MATVPVEKGGGPTELGVIVAKRKVQRLAAVTLIRRRRRILAPIGAAAQEPIQQTTIPRVGMLFDRWKQPVRCASTANVVIATGLEAGDAIDGVTLVAGDRVLLKNQSAATENGVYVAVQSGAGVRAEDAAVGSHLVHAVVGVEQGTVNADKFFVCFTNAPITIGSTSISWGGLGSFVGAIDGSQVNDGSMDVVKLFGNGLSRGAVLFCDGSSWVVLEPPGVKSKLTHDGSGGDPYWEAV